MQSALRMLYPPQCLTCSTLVDSDHGLCGPCWRATPFIHGLVCDKCGVSLPGDETNTVGILCDDCMRIARPWDRGRAAMLYGDNARKLLLAFKHGDRTELAQPAAEWLLRAARPILLPDMLVAPVPLHWTRLFRRRYNQAALLGQRFAALAGLSFCPDLLQRPTRTKPLEGISRDTRFAMLDQAITPHPKRRVQMIDRPVLLIDDVMTSGATLAAASEACLGAGAHSVSVLTLARVAKDT